MQNEHISLQPMPIVELYMSDAICHIASWRPYGVSPANKSYTIKRCIDPSTDNLSGRYLRCRLVLSVTRCTSAIIYLGSLLSTQRQCETYPLWQPVDTNTQHSIVSYYNVPSSKVASICNAITRERANVLLVWQEMQK